MTSGSGSLTPVPVTTPSTGTKLTDVMLEVAQLMGIVREGTATGGTTTTLVDTVLDDPADYYTDGTLWMTSGSNDGACEKVTKYAANTATTAALTYANSVGDLYSIATNAFPKHLLKQAVLHVLKTIMVPSLSTTHKVALGVCTLVSVSNVKIVFVDDARNYHWEERNGKIYFDDTSLNGDLDIWYMKEHATITETQSLDEAVDRRYVAWSACAWLWRNYIQKSHKDNSISIDMLNEAKVNEQMAMKESRKLQIRVLNKDPHFGTWGL